MVRHYGIIYYGYLVLCGAVMSLWCFGLWVGVVFASRGRKRRQYCIKENWL
jgi:hypothetical protein